MTDEGERDKPGSGDLFDDLDRFFAPIEDPEWPDPAQTSVRRPPPRREVPTPPARTTQGDSDVLPELPEFDLGFDEPEEPTAAPPPSPPPAPPVERPAAAPPQPERPWSAEDTASFETAEVEGETGQAAWDRIRSAPAEEAAASMPSPPLAPSGPAYREPGFPSGETELSLDDLQVAPREYADLPGPAAGEQAADTGPAQEPAVAGFDLGQEPPQPPPGVEPRPGDVEDAAEHFAESMRGEPDEAETVEAPSGVEEELLSDLEAGGAGAPRTIRVGDEPLAGPGPAWEEPSSQAVATEAMPAPGGRNVPAALISGVALAGLALILAALGPAPFAFLAGALVIAAQGEFYAVARRRGYHPATALALVMGALILIAAYNRGEGAMAFMLSLGLVLTFLWYMAGPPSGRKRATMNIGVTVLGMVWIPFFAGFLFRIMPLDEATALGIIGLTVIYDVSAFAVGYFWGRRPLAQTISPNKSWEGAIGASLITLIVALAFGPQISIFTAGRAVAMGLMVVVAAPLGDLAESAVKRDLGVKDMSTVMPGHGGLLDRLDSLLFVAPAAYYLLLILF